MQLSETIIVDYSTFGYKHDTYLEDQLVVHWLHVIRFADIKNNTEYHLISILYELNKHDGFESLHWTQNTSATTDRR